MAAQHRGFFSWTWHVIASRPRLLIGLACGFAALPLLPDKVIGPTRVILAWDTGVIVYLMLCALLFTTERLDRVAADAAEQEEGEWTIFGITVAAVTFSFATILSEFAHISALPESERGPHIALVAITLFVSWLMTHTTFAMRYAHEYYQINPKTTGINGGLEFPSERHPDYLDFMYFSLVIGMTFQVSDVEISGRTLRRLATLHGLLSFLYNTIILALTVNIAAGLL